MLSRISLITGLLTSLALLGHAPAQASNRDAAIAGAVVGAVIGGVIMSHGRPVQVYEAPPPAYYPPPPVAYYPPRAVYYERQPVYYTPGPVYYVPEPPRHRRWHGHQHRRHHDGYGRRW